MPNPRFSTQDWFCHPANKKKETEAIGAPPASQIPGLSNLPDDATIETEDDRTFRRKWIRDTDSKYIRLAKKGGRQDLLAFREPKPKSDEAVQYPRVDWFDHEHPYDEEEETNENPQETDRSQKPLYRVLPDWYIHDNGGDDPELANIDCRTIPGIGRRGQPPQNMKKTRKNILSWPGSIQVEGEANTTQSKLPPLKVKKEKKQRPRAQVATSVHEKNKRHVKLPQIKKESVDFSHLMAMGYQHDWFDEQRVQQNQQRQEKEEQRREKQNKKVNQMSQAIQLRKPRHSSSEENKPLFKLSKFQKVQPRVESFRL